MANVIEFNFVDSKSGKITYTPPSSYVAATGYGSCQTGQNTITSAKWRAFFNFDTSSLPDNALVTMVEFLICKNTAQPGGVPQYYWLKFSIGTFIGAALNGNSGEFNGGTLMVTLPSSPTDNTWLDLDQDGNSPQAYVNLTGDTDVKVWDDSIRGSGDASWGLNFNTNKAKCKLRVTYTIPSATATGRGTASAIARVVVAGRSTATGTGTGQSSATVRSVGASTATGCGRAQLTAVVTASGSSTVTGRGTAQVEAAVAVTGSADASGRGTAEVIVAVIVAGVGTATGRGTFEIIAWVTVSAAVSATGQGTASCEARVEERTASATATGRGFAFCRLTAIYFDPLARHFGTRTARVGSADARSVSRVHNAGRACAAEDARLRGARRN